MLSIFDFDSWQAYQMTKPYCFQLSVFGSSVWLSHGSRLSKHEPVVLVWVAKLVVDIQFHTMSHHAYSKAGQVFITKTCLNISLVLIVATVVVVELLLEIALAVMISCPKWWNEANKMAQVNLANDLIKCLRLTTMPKHVSTFLHLCNC